MSQNDNLLFLQNFNKKIDSVSEEIKGNERMSNSQFYNLVVNSLNEICRKMSYQNEAPEKQIAVVQEDRMFEIILNFFKSIDIELYNKAEAIIKNKYPNTKTYIYDYHKEDTNNTTCYGVQYEEGKAKVFLPLGYKQSKEEIKKIIHEYGEDYYTIDDLYSITHEISHLFDIQPEHYTKTPSKTRDVLTETTPNIFETFLSDYLLKEGLFEEHIITEKNKSENNKLLTHAHIGRIKLEFLELKRKKGEITEEDIEFMMEKDMLSKDEFINIINLIAYSDVSLVENRRYAFARMYAPIICQKCKTSSNKRLLQKYLYECSQNIPFTDILSAFGVDFKGGTNGLNNNRNIEI